MVILYDIVFFLFAAAYFPYLLIKGKCHRGFGVRMGFFPRALRQRLAGGRSIWFHAVSVGEVLAVIGLMERIKKAAPKRKIVLSTVTPTGYATARSRLPDEIILLYAPLDFSLVVQKFIRLIRPVLYVTAETEIWPNVFSALARSNVPIVQINGRLSQKAYRRYRMVRPLLKPVLRGVSVFCMQTPEDAQRMTQLGVASSRVKTVGNMKFDDCPSDGLGPDETDGILAQGTIWIAGSTHPGEEEIVLDIYQALHRDFPDLRLVIAPRHVERTREIIRLIEARSLQSLCLSQVLSGGGGGALREGQVLVVDTIGHLRTLYRKASLVFVGKSLTGQGGQNIIEPAFFAKPVLVGPHMQNFESIVRIFAEAGGVVQVKDAGELKAQARRMLEDPRWAQSVGRSAQAAIENHRGATARTQEIIEELLARKSSPYLFQ